MGLGLSMLVAATSVLAANSAPPDPAPNRFSAETAIITHLLFDLDLKTFTRQYASLRRTNKTLDWTSDGCSAPLIGDSGRSFDFRWPCVRHDFGYRNFKSHDLFNDETRLRIDDKFRQDLDESCRPRMRSFKVRCLAWAEIYYSAVRAMGGS